MDPIRNSKDSQEISLWLDSYDDLFSDFDPRPYSKRTISDDFIVQVRKVSRDRPGKHVQLKLLLPEKGRQMEVEKVITERMSDYFYRNHRQIRLDIRRMNIRGAVFLFSGIGLMALASYISFLKPDSFYYHLLLILTEPAGWFLLWMGLDNLVYYARKTAKDVEFYSRMSSARIEFGTY